MKNARLYIILLVIAIISLLGFVAYLKYEDGKHKKANDLLRKELIAQDSLSKVNEGEYRRLVNIFSTAKDLEASILNMSKKISDLVKKNGEKPVMTAETEFKFKDTTTTTKVSMDNQDSIIRFTSTYPKKNPHTILKGSLNTKTKILEEKWEFNPIKIGLVVTEKPNGLWESYVIGDENMLVTSLDVKTLPKVTEKTKKPSFVSLYGGGGAIKIGRQTEPTVNFDAIVGRKQNMKISTMVAPTTIASDKLIVGASVGFKF